MASKLAIVIPAYKADFFSQCLDSLDKQTCKDFHLYVGDDASPNNLKAIVDQYENKINLSYSRFANNLGREKLTKQWNRCIELTKGEEFIWLFSDDDLLPSDAVQRFYDFQHTHPGYDVYRFNIQLINQINNPITESSKYKTIEKVEEFIVDRLLGKTHSSVVEYIFTREVYKKIDGFVEFPLAWASDDATLIKMGKEKGIITIPGNPVLWRMSGINITTCSQNNNIKFRSMLLFYRWVKEKVMNNNFPQAQLSVGVFRQAYILRITLFSFIINFFRIIELVGFRDTWKLGYRTLKLNIKNHLEYL